jgi:hypothetical protein
LTTRNSDLRLIKSLLGALESIVRAFQYVLQEL